MDVRTKRIYDDPEPGDGARVLVDRLWPRGVSKADAALDNWAREIAPSDALREWFDHDPERWAEFQDRYAAELEGNEAVLREEVLDVADGDRVTLLYAATDTDHNNAVALQRFVERRGLVESDG